MQLNIDKLLVSNAITVEIQLIVLLEILADLQVLKLGHF